MPRVPRNILLLLTDEQRPDTIGAYGNPRIQTPNADRLAAQGVLFEQAYCAHPVCSPSSASLLTGLHPHTHGVVLNSIPLDPAVPTLAEFLRPAGYVSGFIGKWHLGQEHRPRHGFEEYWITTEDGYIRNHAANGYSSYYHFLMEQGFTPKDPHLDGVIFNRATTVRLPEEVSKPAFQAGKAIEFLEKYRDRPFLLSVSLLEPHGPFTGPLDGLYRAEDMTLPASWYRELEEGLPLRTRLLRWQHQTGDTLVLPDPSFASA